MSSLWTIRRSRTDAKLTGVCGGIAEHWGVDPVLIRVGCALLALSGGIGIVLYVAGWLLIPSQDTNEPAILDLLGPQARAWPRALWILLVALCCLLAFAVLGTLTPFGFGPAAILAMVWYVGYDKNRRARRGTGAAAESTSRPPLSSATAVQPPLLEHDGPATPSGNAESAWWQRTEQVERTPTGESAYRAFLTVPDPVGLYTEPRPAAVALPPVNPSRAASRSAKRLRLVAGVVLGVILGGLGVADALGVAVSLAAYWATALLVLGLTLICAAWLGRARGILPVSVLVLLATLGSVVAGPVVDQQAWGSVQRTYTSTTELVAGDRQQLGQLRVDLSGLTATTDTSYTAHVDLGSLEVTAPPTMNVVINWQVKSGAMLVNRQQVRGGTNLVGVERPPRTDPSKKTLVLNLSVDRGVVQVRR